MARARKTRSEGNVYGFDDPAYVKQYFDSWLQEYNESQEMHESFLIDQSRIWSESEELQHLFTLNSKLLDDQRTMSLLFYDLYRERNYLRNQIKNITLALKTDDKRERKRILKALNAKYEDFEFLKFFRKQVEDRI